MKKHLYALFLFVFTSCYTTKTIVTPIDTIMNLYNGSTEQQIKLIFGAPNRTTDDGNGGKILVYENFETYTQHQFDLLKNPNNLYNPYSFKGSSVSTSNSSYMQFYIDKESKVYSWKTNYPGHTQKIRTKDKEKTKWAWARAFVVIYSGVILGLNTVGNK